MKRIIKLLFTTLIIIFLMLNIIIQVVLSLTNATFSIIDIYTHPIPIKDNLSLDHPKKFIINSKSYFEKQGLNQCAGFSSAYLLRYNGINKSGDQVYNEMNYKFGNGYVLPKGVKDILTTNNINYNIYKGNIDQLKNRLHKNNNPIIVLIGDGLKWQHYVTVLGYSESEIYLYDSLVSNTDSSKYNRVLATKDFIKLWNNKIPLYENIYISD